MNAIAQRKWVLITTLSVLTAALPYGPARGQATSAAQQGPPKIIEGCYTTPGMPASPCYYWIRKNDGYDIVPHFTTDPTEVAELVRFDKTGVEIRVSYGAPANRVVMTFTGTVKGNRIEGQLVQTISAGTATVNGKPIPWAGAFFYPPSSEQHSTQTAFVACDTKVSMVNTGDHSVTGLDLKLNQFQFPAAMTVSADGTKAYISTNGQTATFYPAKLLVADAASASITQTFDLKSSPVPGGFLSMAIAGDGTTLYGSGQDIKKLGTELMALDATNGATLGSVPYQPKDSAHANGQIVISGTRLVLGDGTIPNLPAPKGGVSVFGSDGKGLAALPDGQTLCLNGKAIPIGQSQPSTASQPCNAVAGSSTVVAPEPSRGFGSANLFGRLTTADEMLSGTKGMTPDGKTLFVTFPPNGALPLGTDKLATVDAVTGFMTDVVEICDKPSLLAMPPVTR